MARSCHDGEGTDQQPLQTVEPLYGDGDTRPAKRVDPSQRVRREIEKNACRVSTRGDSGTLVRTGRE
ncbi:hypothetical protein ACFY2M_35015 [Streptomyces sp. NPDC001276]|uniref:hypothetical protein n=1 Tax=Streptomyces sp. NPDC001276 TaxID=3364555 RepID=UPI00367EE2FD